MRSFSLRGTTGSSNLSFLQTLATLLGLGRLARKQQTMDSRSYFCRAFVAVFLCFAIQGSPSRAQVSSPEALGAAAEDAYGRGAFDRAIEGWLRAAEEFEQAGRLPEQVDALVHVAESYQNIGLFTEALNTLETARALNQEASNPTQVRILGTQGSIYLAQGSNQIASDTLTRAFDLATELGDNRLAAFIGNNRGKLFAARGEYDVAIATYRDSARLARDNAMPMLAARALSNAATLLCQTGQYDECADFQREGLEVTALLDDSHDKAHLLVTLGLNYTPLVEQFPDRYSELMLRANEAFNQAWASAEAVGDLRVRSFAAGNLGGLYETENRQREALELTRRALSDAQQVDAPASLYRWQWQAGRLLRAMSSRDEAIEAYRSAIITLQTIRQEAPEAYATTATSFRESAGRAYFEMIDLLFELASSAPESEDGSPYLNEARETVELFKLVRGAPVQEPPHLAWSTVFGSDGIARTTGTAQATKCDRRDPSCHRDEGDRVGRLNAEKHLPKHLRPCQLLRNSLPPPVQVRIRRQRCQPRVFDRATNGEVIQALKTISTESEQVVKDVVEVASDPGAPDAGGLGFEVQHLSQQAGLPKESPVPPSAFFPDAIAKIGNHPEAEGPGGGNFLIAAHPLCPLTKVSLNQLEKWQVLRAASRRFPEEVGSQRGPEVPVDGRTPFEDVEARRQIPDSVDENAAMQMWRPGPGVPRRHVGPGQQPVQHGIECRGGNRCRAVESKAAAALFDKPNGVDSRRDRRASRPHDRRACGGHTGFG